MKRYAFYTVDIERKWNPDADQKELPVRTISIQIAAGDITEAMQEAWKAVSVDPNEYEIIAVNNDCHSSMMRRKL